MAISSGSGGPGSFHHRRVADGHGPRRDRLHHHRAGADDAMLADVSHDDGAVADPGVATDGHAPVLPALVLDRYVTAVEVVLVPPAEDVHVAADRGVALENCRADRAAVADHDSGVNFAVRVR